MHDTDEPELAPIPMPARAPVPIPVPDEEPAPAPEPKLRPLPEKMPADLIPGYELQGILGEGSMGLVYQARQVSLDRRVAIKLLTPRLAKDVSFLGRFMREARAVAKLNHPNMVSGIDVGESRGCRYFVMEFVSGHGLHEVLERRGRLEPTQATKIVLAVARALEHAHVNGLVHRDVKPGNIMISDTGRVKLCDLGLAKEVNEGGATTSEGRAMGTPDYISPEQARGQSDIDIRSDLYSLGATLYHLVCGRPPYHGTTPAVIMTKHLTEPLPPATTLAPNLPPGCAFIIHKAMEKDRDKRYQTPAELIEDLDTVLEGRWKEEPKIRRRRRRARRRFR